MNTRTKRTRRGPAGFTLLEVTMASAVFSLALIAALTATATVQRSTTAGIQYSAATADASRILDRFGEDVRNGALGTVVIANPDGDPEVTFQEVTGYDQGSSALTYSTPVTYRWEVDAGELDNGVDDDGDGVVDEGRVARVQDGNSVILARNIAKGGFNVVVAGQGLEVTVRPFYFEIVKGGERVPVETQFMLAVPMNN